MNILKLVDSFNQSINHVKQTSIAANRRTFIGQASSVPAKALAAMLTGFFAIPKTSQAQSDSIITDVLNFALTLEYLEDEFYKNALDSANLIPAADRNIFSQISKHETAHVAFLKNALGSKAVAKPTFDFTAGGQFPKAFSDYMVFLTLSQAFEDTGVRAYKGQAGNLMSNDTILTQALQIHSVEGRHAAQVRWLRTEVSGQAIKPWIENNASDGAPQAVYNGEENITQGGINLNTIAAISHLGDNVKSRTFDEPLTKEQVLTIVSPFIKS